MTVFIILKYLIPIQHLLFRFKKTWVRFASSLGELSLEEISNREKELMVGFTGRNYVLYDKNIGKWENIDL